LEKGMGAAKDLPLFPLSDVSSEGARAKGTWENLYHLPKM
jgi:hypothetical protein